MIRLKPNPHAVYRCPGCRVQMHVSGWVMPGMRTLAILRCERCDREFLGDMLSGHGLYTAALLEVPTGKLCSSREDAWYPRLLRDSYERRKSEPVDFEVEEVRSPRRAVLVNCMDSFYGHCVLKLLNAQYYLDHRRDLDVVVLVPRFLRWLVPHGVAATWTVDVALREGAQWNDWIGEQVRRRVEVMDECWLSVAYSHPHPADYDIERFTHIKPFPLDDWTARLEKPTLTFIWREDRTWVGALPDSAIGILCRQLRRAMGADKTTVERQHSAVRQLAELLRDAIPDLDFGVAGLGETGEFPAWVKDMRARQPDTATEVAWCRRYAESHVVLGVHGSNMLLPSAHAGATLDLMPVTHWANAVQDLLVRETDCRLALFRHRILPVSIGHYALAGCITSLLAGYDEVSLMMNASNCRHVTAEVERLLKCQEDYGRVVEFRRRLKRRFWGESTGAG